jgi:hypothetical protein
MLADHLGNLVVFGSRSRHRSLSGHPLEAVAATFSGAAPSTAIWVLPSDLPPGPVVATSIGVEPSMGQWDQDVGKVDFGGSSGDFHGIVNGCVFGFQLSMVGDNHGIWVWLRCSWVLTISSFFEWGRFFGDKQGSSTVWMPC